MIYADFSYYKDTYCGEMAEGDFKRLSRSASAYLDSVTFDRIAAVTDEKIKEKVKEACCAVADVLLQKEQRGGIASETNDGISVPYTPEGSTDEQRLYRAAVLYLGNTGLLFRGVEGCLHVRKRLRISGCAMTGKRTWKAMSALRFMA